MIDKDKLREEFATRLNNALDKAGVREHGRGVDIQNELKRKGLKASTESIRKWLSGISIPEIDNMKALAEIANVPASWLQFGEGEIPENNLTKISNFIEKEKKQKKDKVIDIPLFDIEASMGKGCVPLDFPQAVINISVDKNFFISRSIPITSNENLAIISGIGDSMEPTFSSGDPIIIDRGITTFKEEGIYIFTLYNELYIKRLQKLPNCLKMISDNKKYEPYDLRGEDLENLIIHGKVLFAWNGKRI